MSYYGVMHIEGGCLQAFELYTNEPMAVAKATEWAQLRGMALDGEDCDRETGNFHDDETDIFVMQPENDLSLLGT